MMMKFDIFDAMKHMEKAFGSDGQISVTQDNVGINIKLVVPADERIYSCDFTVTWSELNHALVDVVGRNFNEALETLKRQIP